MNSWDKAYAEGVDTAPMNKILFRDLFRKVIKSSSKEIKTVLDLGAGTGRLGIELAQKGLSVTESDISKVALGKARKNAQESGVTIETVQGDLEDKEFYSNFNKKFDLIIARFITEFIENRKLLIERINEHLLHTDGSLLLITPVRYENIKDKNYSYELSVPTEDSIISLFKDVFTEVEILHKNYRGRYDCDLYILGKK